MQTGCKMKNEDCGLGVKCRPSINCGHGRVKGQTNPISLPGVLKTGLPEILSQSQHIAGNLSKLNLLKALILLV